MGIEFGKHDYREYCKKKIQSILELKHFVENVALGHRIVVVARRLFLF